MEEIKIAGLEVIEFAFDVEGHDQVIIKVRPRGSDEDKCLVTVSSGSPTLWRIKECVTTAVSLTGLTEQQDSTVDRWTDDRTNCIDLTESLKHLTLHIKECDQSTFKVDSEEAVVVTSEVISDELKAQFDVDMSPECITPKTMLCGMEGEVEYDFGFGRGTRGKLKVILDH